MKKILLTPRQFFLSMLLLPIIVPIFFVLIRNESIGPILFLSLSFGGIQYLVFATAMVILLLKNDNFVFLRRLFFSAPLLFTIFQSAGWILWRVCSSNGGLSGIVPEIVMFGIYSILFGYFYLIVSAVFYFISAKCGFISVNNRVQVGELNG